MHFSFSLIYTADESMKSSKKSQLQELSAVFLKTQTHITDWEKEILIFRKLINTWEYLKKHVLTKKICEFFTFDSNNDVEMHKIKAWKELLKNWQKKYKKMWMIFNWNDKYNLSEFWFCSIQLLILKSLSSTTQMSLLLMNAS